jgi:hypothetical protein
LDDSSDSTITQREIENKDPPETDGGSIKKAAEALEEKGFDIIENIGAITKDKKEAESDDSSDSTITEVKEDNKDPPETDCGFVKKALEALEVFAKPSASDGTSESSSSSSTQVAQARALLEVVARVRISVARIALIHQEVIRIHLIRTQVLIIIRNTIIRNIIIRNINITRCQVQ